MEYKIEFNEERHEYYVDGRLVDGVTSIMKQGELMGWTKRIHPYYAERGSMVHLACHLHDTEGLDMDSLDVRVAGFVKAWMRFKTEQTMLDKSFKILHSEHMFYNPRFDYCGTVDKVVKMNGITKLLDIKCNTCPPTAHIQLGAYMRGLTEHYGIVCDEGRCVVIKEDGTYSLTESLKVKTGWTKFRKILKEIRKVAK